MAKLYDLFEEFILLSDKYGETNNLDYATRLDKLEKRILRECYCFPIYHKNKKYLFTIHKSLIGFELHFEKVQK